MARFCRLQLALIAAFAAGTMACQKSQAPSEAGRAGSTEGGRAPHAEGQVADEGSQEPVTFEGTRIAVVHTANLIGELEPCG